MPSPEDRPPWPPSRPAQPAHRVVNAATLPIASQRPAAPAPHRDFEPPTTPNALPRQSPAARPVPPAGRPANAPPGRPYPPRSPAAPPPNAAHRPQPQPYGPQGTPRHYVQRPEHYLAAPAQQVPPSADPYPFDPPRITTTQRPHRRVDTSVLCAAAALVLLGVAVLVGLML